LKASNHEPVYRFDDHENTSKYRVCVGTAQVADQFHLQVRIDAISDNEVLLELFLGPDSGS